MGSGGVVRRWAGRAFKALAIAVVASLVYGAVGAAPSASADASERSASRGSQAADPMSTPLGQLEDLRRRVDEVQRAYQTDPSSTSDPGPTTSAPPTSGPDPSSPSTTLPDGSTIPPPDAPSVVPPAEGLPDVPTVVEELTTPTREVVLNPDGSYEATLSAAPVRVENEAGEWVPIDTSLVPTADGFEPAQPFVPVVVGDDLRDQYVSVGEVGEQVAFSYPQAAVGDELDHADLVDGVVQGEDALGARRDLEVQVLAGGFKETVTLESASAGGSYLIDLALPVGATLSPAPDGLSVDVLGADGKVLGTYAGGLAWDSSGDETIERSETQVLVSVVSSAPGSARLSVSVDAGWLASAVFPVMIDPYWTDSGWSNATQARSFASGAATVEGAGTLKIGAGPGGGFVYRAHVKFGSISFLRTTHTQVRNATIRLWQKDAGSCDPMQIEAQGLKSWSATPPAWANEASKADTWGPFASPSFNKGKAGCSSTSDPGWVEFDASEIADRWLWGGSPGSQVNNGIRLKASDETTSLFFKEFGGLGATAGGDQVPPQIKFEYHIFPNSGSNTAYGASYGLSKVWSRLPGRQLKVNVDFRNLGYAFTWDHNNVRLGWEVRSADGQTVISQGSQPFITGATVAPGEQASLTAMITAPAEEGTYQIWWDLQHVGVTCPDSSISPCPFSYRGVEPGIHTLFVTPASAFGVDPNQPLHNGVNLAIGSYFTSATDASVPTIGPGLTISRSYNHLNKATDTQMGPGWTWTFGMKVVVPADDNKAVIVYYPDGRRERHTLASDGSSTYVAPPGSAATITRYGVGAWLLTDGRKGGWIFNGYGQLIAIKDEQGRELTITNTANNTRTLTSASGRTLVLGFDGGGRLASATTQDPVPGQVGTGKNPLTWTYKYAQLNAESPWYLDRVCGPDHEATGAAADDQCWNYNYDGAGRLNGIIPPASGAGVTEATRIGYVDGTPGARVLWTASYRKPGEWSFYDYSYVANSDGTFRVTVHGPQVAANYPSGGVDASIATFVTYDAAGRLIERKNDHNNTAYWYYGDVPDPFLVLCPYEAGDDPYACRTIDDRGHSVFFDTDDRGNVTRRVEFRNDANTATAKTQYWKYANDKVIEYRDGRSASSTDNAYRVTTTWSSKGQKLSETKPSGRPAGSGVTGNAPFSGDSPLVSTDYAYSSTPDATAGATKLANENSHRFDPDNPNGTYTWSLPDGLLLMESREGGGNDLTTIYYYNQNGEMTRVFRNVVNGTTSRATDTTSGDAGTLRIDYDYDELGRKVSETVYADGWWSGELVTTFAYDEQGFQHLVTEPVVQDTVDYAAGNGIWTHQKQTRFVFDAEGHALETFETDEGTGAPATSGATVGTPDATRLTTRTFDVAGRELTVTDPLGGVMSRTYHANGQVETVTDQEGRVTRTVYDTLGRPTEAYLDAYCVDPLDPCSQAEEIDLRLTKSEYDAAGRVTATVDALSRRRVTTYHDDGLKISEYLEDYGEYTGTNSTIAQYTLAEYFYDDAGHLTETRSNERLINGLTTKSISTTVYDHAGRPAMTELNTNPVRQAILTYDKFERVTKQTRREASVNPNEINNGGLARVETTTNTYDDAGNLVCQIIENGSADIGARFGYDNRGYQTWRSDPRAGVNCNTVIAAGTATTNGPERFVTRYDEAGRVRWSETPDLQMDGPTGTTILARARIGYDTWGNPTRTKDANGNFTKTVFDKLSRKTRVEFPSYTPPVAGATQINTYESWSYDRVGNQRCFRNRAGALMTYEYTLTNQAFRTRTFTSTALSSCPTYLNNLPDTGEYSTASVVYSETGMPEVTTDVTGAQTSFTYDKLDRVRTETKTIRTLGAGDTPATPANAASQVTRFSYDRAGHVVRTELDGPPDRVTTVLYENSGSPWITTDPTGKQVVMVYDLSGRVLRAYEPHTPGTTPADVRYSQSVYDLAGRQTIAQLVSPNPTVGQPEYIIQTRTEFVDYVGLHLIRSFKPESNYNSTSGAFDNDLAITTNDVLVGEAITDQAGRLFKVVKYGTSAGDAQTIYGYDKNANLTRIWLPKDAPGGVASTDAARVTKITYTSWNQQERYIEPGGDLVTPEAEGQRTFVTGYDETGAPAHDLQPPLVFSENQVTNAAVHVAHDYDTLGRKVDDRDGNASNAVLRSFSYDTGGRMTGATTPGGRSLTFVYDDRGQLRRSGTTDNAYLSVFRYNQAGELSWREDTVNGSPVGEIEAGYTLRGELDTLSDTRTNTTREYIWTTNGQLDRIDYGTGTNVANRDYGYDIHGRLATDTLKNTAGAVTSARQYGYDPSGNVTSRVDLTGPTVGNHTYSYNTAGQLTSWLDNTGANTAYGYDLNGNRTGWVRSGATPTYEEFSYDGRNRLLGSNTNTGASLYSWSARGTINSTWVNGVTTNYAYDPLGRQTQTGAIDYTYDALDRVATRETAAFSYVGSQIDPLHDGTITYLRSPGGRPIAAIQGATVVIPELDRHGDLVALHTPVGAVTDTASYKPFGEPNGKTGSFNPSIGYQGDYTDPTTNQVWMGARWYTPGTATFTSRDTYAGDVNNPISLNRYTYAHNSPIRYWDPDGRCVQSGCADAIAMLQFSCWSGGLAGDVAMMEFCKTQHANIFGTSGGDGNSRKLVWTCSIYGCVLGPEGGFLVDLVPQRSIPKPVEVAQEVTPIILSELTPIETDACEAGDPFLGLSSRQRIECVNSDEYVSSKCKAEYAAYEGTLEYYDPHVSTSELISTECIYEINWIHGTRMGSTPDDSILRTLAALGEFAINFVPFVGDAYDGFLCVRSVVTDAGMADIGMDCMAMIPIGGIIGDGAQSARSIARGLDAVSDA